MSWSDFDEVFDMECQKQYDETTIGRLEVTLGYPATSRYKRYVTKTQEYLHKELFDYMRVQLDNVITYRSTIERSDSGKIHLHGYIEVNMKGGSVEGIITDCVNTIYSQLPKRSQMHQKKYHYCHKYKVFRSPPICIQYTELSDAERTNVWDDYIRKSLPII